MVSLEKWMILTHLQKLPKNGEDLGKLIVAKGFKRLPKVQNIAQSGRTGGDCTMWRRWWPCVSIYSSWRTSSNSLTKLNPFSSKILRKFSGTMNLRSISMQEFRAESFSYKKDSVIFRHWHLYWYSWYRHKYTIQRQNRFKLWAVSQRHKQIFE